MKTVVSSYLPIAFAAGGVQYAWPCNAAAANTVSNTELDRAMIVPVDCTISNLSMLLTTAPGTAGSGKSWNLKVRKSTDGGVTFADTAVSVTISDGATTGEDTTHTASFAAGDFISIQSTPTGTPTQGTAFRWCFYADTGGTKASPIMGGVSTSPPRSTAYMPIMGGSALSSTVESDYSGLVAAAGSIQGLRVMLETAPAGATGWTFTLYVNGNPTALTCTISGSATTGSDLSHSVAVSPGDTISLQETVTGVPNTSMMKWSMQFVPTTDGESFMCFGEPNKPTASATRNEAPVGPGGNAWGTTNGSRQTLMLPTTAKAMYYQSATPVSGRTMRLMNNAAATALSLTTTSAATANVVTDVSLGDGDLINWQVVEVATNSAYKLGLRLYIKPPVNITLGVATETDTAFGITHSKSRTLGVAQETDTAFRITKSGTHILGVPFETDTAFAIVPSKKRLIGPAATTDSALPLARSRSRVLGVASTTSTAFALAASKSSELIEALATPPGGSYGTKQLHVRAWVRSPTDTATLTLRLYGAGTLIQASSPFNLTTTPTDYYFDITAPIADYTTLSVGMLASTTTGQATPVVGMLELLLESVLGVASTTDTALPVTPARSRLVTTAHEVDVALPVVPSKVGYIGTAVDSAIAGAATAGKMHAIGTAISHDTARPIYPSIVLVVRQHRRERVVTANPKVTLTTV